MAYNQGKFHRVSRETYVWTWLALLGFTAVTILVATMDLGVLSTAATILIAAAKSSLVLLYFMHLRFEAPVFRYAFVAAILTLAVFIILTYCDIFFLTRG